MAKILVPITEGMTGKKKIWIILTYICRRKAVFFKSIFVQQIKHLKGKKNYKDAIFKSDLLVYCCRESFMLAVSCSVA